MTSAHVERPTAASTSEQAADYDQVRQQIENWPAAERARLAQFIINTLVAIPPPTPKRRNAVAEIFGRMAAPGPPTSEDEVRQLVDDIAAGRRHPSVEIAGRMNFRQPAPTDEEVAQMIEEERMERYG